MTRRPLHKQVPVKVNTFVDKGIVPIIKALNDIDGISTFSSCEGIKGKERAHVYFDLGQYSPRHWQKLAKLAAKLAEVLSHDCDADISLEWSGGKDSPFISIVFEPQYTLQIAKILSDHRNELVYDI
jgi:hypothetical protein